MKNHLLLLLALFTLPVASFAQDETLQSVTGRGYTTNTHLVIAPASDVFRAFSVQRLNSTTGLTSQLALANNKSFGAITWHTDIVTLTPTYALYIGANLLNYYNNGTTETIWRSGNFNPANYLQLTGGNITGNITIGTSAAQKQLNVNGNIKARKVKVTLTDWADYVFDTAYYLMPLPQLEHYIKVNKHLPNIPSAEIVKEEGVDLGEHHTLLLRKIEELTLYILEQNRKNEVLEKKVADLEKKLNGN